MTRYELLDRIGVGGMAEIFRGRALAAGGFEKPVAIKRILPHLCQDQRFVELLIAEAKVLSLLRHRNIVQIFDVGLGDDGQYFLVMEFVNGLDLGRVQRGLEAKRRLLPVDLALHIGAEVCEALEHAHIANDPEGRPMRLVHRDVSPSNVLISQAGEVKLTDFGIAKRAEEATGHGTVRGKFAYISPEQARNEHVDPRSDVFSLGIVLFELLTGRRLFSQLPDLDALHGVREGKIPRAREIDGNLSMEIDELLARALARDPAKRFASAGEFGSALRSLRYSLEVSSGDPSAELSRVVSSAEGPPTIPPKSEAFETGEATVIRIQTAAAFSMNDDRTAFTQARRVIDRFEEEETRMSKLGPETLRNLRAFGEDPGAELAPPPSQRRSRAAPTPRQVPRKSSITGDEPTSLAGPLELVLNQELASSDAFDADEETIARPSPFRGPGPATVKRVPPPAGPRGTSPAKVDRAGSSSEAAGARRMPRQVSAHVVRSATASVSAGAAPVVLPSAAAAPGPLPEIAGWEPPSFSTPAPPKDATPAPTRLAAAALAPSPSPASLGPMAPTISPAAGVMAPMVPAVNQAMAPTMLQMSSPPVNLGNPPMNPAVHAPVNLGGVGMNEPGSGGAVPNPAAMAHPHTVLAHPPSAYPSAYPPAGGMQPSPFPQQRNQPYPSAGQPPRVDRIERWRTAALVLGAIAMAVLAFAVTRSCMHPERTPSSRSLPAGR